MMFIIFLAGCHSSHSIDSSDLDQYDVSQIRDETIQDEFIFRLVSEKEEYKKGEEVKLFGELEYIGEKDKVTIHHAASAIRFPMEEKMRGYNLWDAVNEIGLSTILTKGEPYREKYVKRGISFKSGS